MAGEKIKYTCKNCGWSTSIREEWSDMKPRRCMNKKCNTSFEKHKDALEIEMPKAAPVVVEQIVKSKPQQQQKHNPKSSKNEQQDD